MKACQCKLASDYDMAVSEASPHRKLLCACLDRALRDLDPTEAPAVRRAAIAWLEGRLPATEDEESLGAISFSTVKLHIVYTPRLDRLIKKLLGMARFYEQTGTLPADCVWKRATNLDEAT